MIAGEPHVSNSRIDDAKTSLGEQIGKEARMEAGEHGAHGFPSRSAKKSIKLQEHGDRKSVV